MIRGTLVLGLAFLLMPVAFAEQDPNLLPAMHADATPTIDGLLGTGEWQTPVVHTFSSADVPNTVIASGSFSGADDLSVEIRALFTPTNIYVALQIHDDVKATGDRVIVEIGNQTITLSSSGAVTGPGVDWAAVVTQQVYGWNMEIRIGAELATPTVLEGALLPINVRVDDDDEGDVATEGVLWRNDVGAGSMYFAAPRMDMTTAIAMIDGAALDPDATGNLAKQSRRLTKAADELAWADVYGHASKADAAKSLDRIRTVVRKLQKYRDRAPDTAFAHQIDATLDRIMIAVRLASAKMVRRSVQKLGIAASQEALDRLATAEAETGTLDRRVKLYRKAAKKAAKLYF